MLAVPEGLAYCPGCRETKDKALFREASGRRSGLQKWCQACNAESNRKRAHVQGRAGQDWPIFAAEGATVIVTRRADGFWVPSEKICHACRKVKVVGDYSVDATNFDGLNHYCKGCCHEKYLQF